MRWLAWLLLLAGCEGTGTLSLTTWGEDFIERGIPAGDFADGSSVHYTRFLLVLKDFTLATRTGEVVARQAAPAVVDLTRPGPLALERFEGLPAGVYEAVGYTIGPAPDARGLGAIEPADVERMRSGGHAVLVEGELTTAGGSKRFAWAFSQETRYQDCGHPDLGSGLNLTVGNSTTAQLTIHGDHLWYDDLQSPQAALRGEALAAADADADGLISTEELRAFPLAELPPGSYEAAGAASIKTLEDYLGALSRTVGHFRGEGDCTPRVVR